MSAAHTPGPWEAKIYGGWDTPRVWSASGSIAMLQHHDSGPAEAEANARLIATAPRMAKALQRAASLLAELGTQEQTPQMLALRTEIVETIKEATPEYYGGAA